MTVQPSLGLGIRAIQRAAEEQITPGEFLRRCGDPAPEDRMEDHYLRASSPLAPSMFRPPTDSCPPTEVSPFL